MGNKMEIYSIGTKREGTYSVGAGLADKEIVRIRYHRNRYNSGNKLEGPAYTVECKEDEDGVRQMSIIPEREVISVSVTLKKGNKDSSSVDAEAEIGAGDEIADVDPELEEAMEGEEDDQ